MNSKAFGKFNVIIHNINKNINGYIELNYFNCVLKWKLRKAIGHKEKSF